MMLFIGYSQPQDDQGQQPEGGHALARVEERVLAVIHRKKEPKGGEADKTQIRELAPDDICLNAG